MHDRERALGVGAVDRRGSGKCARRRWSRHVVVELDVRRGGTARRRAARGWCGRRPRRSSSLRRVHDRSSPIACAGHSVGRGRRRRAAAHRAATRRRSTRDRLGPVDRRCRPWAGSSCRCRRRRRRRRSGSAPRDDARRRPRSVSVPSSGSTSTREVLVRRARGPSAAHRGGRAGAVDGAVACASRSRAPRRSRPRPRGPARAAGGSRSSRPTRRARAARPCVASRSSSGSPGAASWKVNSTVPSASVRRSTSAMRAPASSGPRIISSTHRIFWPTTTVGDPLARRGRARPAWGTRRRRRPRRGAPGPRRAAGRSTSPPRCAAVRVHHDGRRRRRVDGRSPVARECVAGERLADVAGFLVAHADRVDDLVGAARARRVVRAVEDQVLPAEVEQRVAGRRRARGTARSAARRRARGAFGAGRGLVHVDPVRRHAHQHVGARAGAQLAAPRRADRRPAASRDVLAERRDREAVLRLRRRWRRRRRGPSHGWGRRWSDPFISNMPPPGSAASPSSAS